MARNKKKLLRLLIPCPSWYCAAEEETREKEEEIVETIRSADRKIERAIATINGDLDWFLCFTNNKECESGSDSS